MAPTASAEARETLEKAKTLPLAEARLGLAKTQPISAVEPPAPKAPRRVRPVVPLPVKQAAGPKLVAPSPQPVAPVLRVSPPAVRPLVSLPSAQLDDGWSQGRKRNRVEAVKPASPLKLAEGTQPGVNKAKVPAPQGVARKPAAQVVADRPVFSRGSVPPPTTGKPLPSLYSVIDRKPTEPPAGKLPGLPPPPVARPSIGPKKAVSSVVAAASLGAAPMAMAATRQTGDHSVVPSPVQMLLDDEVEELVEVEPDMPDFVPTSVEVAGMLANARSKSAPLFDAPPRRLAVQATQFSAAEAAFFAAGDELDTIEMEPGDETFDDLPGIERPSFWSRLKNRASAGH